MGRDPGQASALHSTSPHSGSARDHVTPAIAHHELFTSGRFRVANHWWGVTSLSLRYLVTGLPIWVITVGSIMTVHWWASV